MLVESIFLPKYFSVDTFSFVRFCRQSAAAIHLGEMETSSSLVISDIFIVQRKENVAVRHFDHVTHRTGAYKRLASFALLW